MNTILIFGGTGAMGEYLVNILSQSEDTKIFVTTRKKRNSKNENVFYVEGDAKNDTFLSEIICREKWDCIVDFMVYSTDEFKNRVNLLLNSTEQYIFLSSSRVYANSEVPITEDSPRLLDVCNDNEYFATDEYALTKARQENILFDSQRKNWTIIRPYITYSEQRLQLGVLEKELWLYAALNCGVLVFSQDIAIHKTTLTFGYDVARSIAALIFNEKAYSQAFHITTSQSIYWKEVYDIYSKVLKKHNVPFENVMKEKTHRLENGGKYQVIYDRYYDRVFDNSSISKFIDTSTFTRPEIGLEKCLEEFLSKPEFRYFSIDSIMGLLRGTKGNLSLKNIDGIKNKIKYLLIKLNLR